MIINPIFASSARRRMRSWKVPVIITVFGALMLYIAFITGISWLMNDSMTITSPRSGLDSYVFVTAMEFLLIVIVAPVMTAGSIAGERERQTLEMLLVANTGSFRITIGKLLESFLYQALIIVAMLPFNCSVLAFGGVGLDHIFESALFLLITALAASSVGLFCSAVLKKTVTSTIAAYLAVLAIGFFTLLPLLTMGKGLSDIDMSKIQTMQRQELFAFLPVSVFVNPVFGLVMLLADQSGVLRSTIQNYLPYGYSIYAVLEGISFGLLAKIVMVCMACAGMVFTLLAALFVRPRIRVRRRT